MPNGAATYTTYLRTELDPATRQSYSQLRGIAESTYRDISRFAQDASSTTAAALNDRRATTGFRNIEAAAAGTFGSIRREAATTSAAVSALQARLSGVRSAAIGGGGVAPAQISSTRAAAAANDNLTASTRRLAAGTSQLSTLQQRQRQTTTAIGVESSKAARSLTVLGTTLSVVQGPLGPVAGRINAITAAISTLGTGTLVLAGAATALFAFAGVASVYAEVESRLKPLYSTQQQVNAALRETGRIALATRSALGPTADFYAKLTSAGRDYGLTGGQVSRVTETAAKAATLSGGNAASREAGLYQFSQGLSSGKLGGDELRSILENIPELARAIASGFKNVDGSIGTTIGQLRKLGAEGALSTAAVVDALGRSGTEIDAKFAKLPKTISSAQTEFVTSFTLLTGQIDHTVGVTSTLANALSVAAQNLQTLIALGGALAARFILPRLGSFIQEQRTAIALQRQLTGGANIAAAAGQATLLTPRGIERAKAVTQVNTAAAAVNDARARVAAEQQVVAAIEREVAATTTAAAADREKSRAAAANARFDVASSQQRVNALRAELTQLEANKAAAATNVATYARAAPAVNRPLAAGETEATRTARITAFTNEQRAAKLSLAQADLRAAGTARALAAANLELEAATAAATGAVLTQTQAANASATRGFAALALQEQRIAANVALAASTAEVVVADTALAGAEARLTIAQVAYNTAASVGTAVMGGLKTAAVAVSTAFGGPFVLALTAVAGALIYMAGQSNAALDALHNFSGGQEELYRRLGITTDKLREQSDAYRELTLTSAQASVSKARAAREDAGRDLAGSLVQAASGLGVGGSLGVGGLVVSGQDAKDRDLLLGISRGLRGGGALGERGVGALSELQRRRPDLFKTSGINGALAGFVGARADDTGSKIEGNEAARLTLRDAQRNLRTVEAELAKPRVKPKPTVPLTPAQIIAQGENAARDEYANPRATAKRRYEEAQKRILADKNDTDAEKADKIRDAKAAYDAQTLSIEKRDAAASKREAAKAAREHAKEEREAAKATRETAAATEKLADLRGRYDDAPKLVDQVRNDQRAFEALVGRKVNVTGADGKVTRQTYSATDAATDSAKAQEALNKPFTDMTREMDRQAQIQTLVLQGREAEADALGRAYTLIDRTGTLEAGQYQALVQAAEAQQDINARLADRQRIVSTLSGAVDEVRTSALAFLNDLPNGAGKASANLAKNLFSSFKAGTNKLIVDNLFGGVQKRIDDLISGKTALQNATTFTAQQATRTGGIVQRFGDVVGAVADRVEQTLSRLSSGSIDPIGQSGVGGGIFAGPESVGGRAVGATRSDIETEISRLGDQLSIAAGGGRADGSLTTDAEGDIVVTAKAKPRKAKDAGRAPSLREIYNESGRSIGDRLDKTLGTKFLGGIGAKVGDALNGAAKGSFASSIASAVGIKQSKTGAAIGGAAGALSGIPFGAEIGGLLGGTLGGLFKKTKQASSTLAFNATTGTLSGGAGVGQGAEAKSAATQLGTSLATQLTSIAEQLGGAISGSGSISVGYRPGHKDGAYRVDPTGQGRLTGVLAFDTEEEAIAAATRIAIQNGVIGGISQASQNILKSGQDLQKAITKALLIESVPKRLLALTDPVRAAVEDLNAQYKTLIDALNEGGASADQFSQAQKLYDIERTRTIAEAQKAATGAIDQYLKEITAGNNSPLNKATVYANASTEFNRLGADVRAGKSVDQDDLVSAATKFQDASRSLYGSSQSFFSDFDTLRALLTQAKSNTGIVDSSGSSTLPGIPFSSTAVETAIATSSNATVQATEAQTVTLMNGLADLADAIRETGSTGGYSSLDNLAAFRALS